MEKHAAFSGELEICRFLLEQGADLNLAAGSPYEWVIAIEQSNFE